MTTIDTNLSAEEVLGELQYLAEAEPEHLQDALDHVAEVSEVSAGDAPDCCTDRLDEPGEELSAGEDGAVDLSDLPTIERIVATDNQLPVHFLSEGALVQKAVGRVQLTEAYSGLPSGSGWGTGSLISDTLFLTNNHVIPSKAFAGKVRAQFNYQSDHNGVNQVADAYEFDAEDVFITSSALDYTVIRLKRKAFPISMTVDGLVESNEDSSSPAITTIRPDLLRSIDKARIGKLIPGLTWLFMSPGTRWGHLRLPSSGPSYAVDQYFNVIGHPRGRRKEVALQDNKVTNVYTNAIRYTTDTEPGSSGSPVFDNGWNVVALHHAAGTLSNGVWVSNEGIRIDKIVDDIQSRATASVTAELGI